LRAEQKGNSLRIAQLAPNIERVPPDSYGGIELVVHLLTEALVERGHDVTLFASGNSITTARLISVADRPLRNNPDVLTRQGQAFDIHTLLKLTQMQDQFDIVHNHMGYQALPYLAQLRCPVLSTNHNPIKPYNLPIYRIFKDLPYVAISNAFKRLNYEGELNYVATVYNGIDLKQFAVNETQPRSFLLFLGRVCADKGTAVAVEIAKALNLPLKIAGKVDESDRSYFEREVKPHLGKDIEYVGEVNHTRKVDLYQKAIAVVYAIAFEEPFGLVMVESLACGTPVMALNRGSVSEVLSDHKTAIIADSSDQLIARFPEVGNILASACRKRVEHLFSKETMVANYENVYENLLKRSPKAYGKDYAST
jgi:glycosyltransferase involved in cell wall biosynthesis